VTAVRRVDGIAVVVPCRDAAPWLAALLDSLAGQSRRPDEVVVVDDGSRDGSAGVVEQWTRQNPTLPVTLLQQPASGVHAAVRRALAATDRALVARIDADDLLEPRYLEALDAALVAHPEAGYAYSAMRMFGAAEGRYYTRPFDAASLVLEGNFVCAGALMRREAYDRTAGVADLPAWEDWDLWLSFLDAGYEGVLVDEELYLWRRHARSRNTLSLARRRLLRLRIMWRHRGLVRRHAREGWRGAVRRWRHPVRQQ
jgi:glycosyltransferase involved in cell wall biosynthesis